MIIINHLRLDADDWMMHHHLDERDGHQTDRRTSSILRVSYALIELRVMYRYIIIRLKTEKKSVIGLKTHNSLGQPTNPRGGIGSLVNAVFLPYYRFLAQF